MFHFNAPPLGAADSKIDRTWLYSLTDSPTDPQNLVFDAMPLSCGGPPQHVQSYDLIGALGALSPSSTDIGLAIYPSS
jgi:hypothetical protein